MAVRRISNLSYVETYVAMIISALPTVSITLYRTISSSSPTNPGS
jgi:hypothetical protein